VRMRPINIKPASVAGGSVTTTSAFLISFSRTKVPDPPICYWEPVNGVLNSRHPHASATSLVERYDNAQLLSIKWRSRAEPHSEAS
jgi:hypothetical protein